MKETQDSLSDGRGANETPRAHLAAILEQAGEAFIVTNPTGVITYVNPAFERLTGYRREEAIGKHPSILKSGRQDEAFYRVLWRTILSGSTWRGRFINRRKDGSLYEQWATIAPLYNESGKLDGFAAVQVDMTSQLELERRLAQAERLASVGEAISGAAHTIKNILNTMHTGAYVVDRALLEGDPEKLHKVWEIYTRNMARLDQLTNRMLDFVRSEPLQLEPMDVGELCREVAADCQSLAEQGGVKFELELPEGLPRIPCDHTAMHDALLNLAGNAIEACGGCTAGRVCLSAAALPNAGGVEIAVEDNGSGISEENRAKLFQPFFSTKGSKGNGLGLATVRKIIQAHRGEIFVESEPGRTRFAIRLPL